VIALKQPIGDSASKNRSAQCRAAGIAYVPPAPDACMQSLWDANAGSLRRVPRARLISGTGWIYIGVVLASSALALGAFLALQVGA